MMSDSIIALPSVVWLVTIRLVGGSVGVEAIIQILNVLRNSFGPKVDNSRK